MIKNLSVLTNLDKNIVLGKQPVSLASQSGKANNLLLSVVFVIGVTLIGVVVFWLPDNVEAPVIAAEQKGPSEQDKNLPAKPLADSPWKDAQLAKHRREAQDILSNLLSIQEELEQKQVNLWANEAFETAMKTAEEADVLYRQREFSQAKETYLKSLSQFEYVQSLEASVFQDVMTKGSQALVNSKVQDAIDSFLLATNLQPGSTSAQEGWQRAMVLADVIKLVDESKVLQLESSFDLALIKAKGAVKLDDVSQIAANQLASIEQAITDKSYNDAMSNGYAALNKRDYEVAGQAFSQALKIKPQQVDAQRAKQQAMNKQVSSQVTNLFQEAQSHEENEDWQQAIEAYTAISALDASLVNAKIGNLKSVARANLDKSLQGHIDQPFRLSTRSVFRKASQSVDDAKALLANSGVANNKRLQQQVTALSELLVNANKKIDVLLESDNHTLVKLFRVGELGVFSDKKLSLVPGEYTVIGTRAGFRDVRHDFILTANSRVPTIVVKCNEAVNAQL